jgi:hypothetical protein
MSGFTPNSTVSIRVTAPDGRDGNSIGGGYAYITSARTDSRGKFQWRWWWGDLGTELQVGFHRTTITDDSTGRSVSARFSNFSL